MKIQLKDKSNRNEIRNDIDPEQLATIIMGGIRKTILNWKLEGFKSDLNLEGEKLWITIKNISVDVLLLVLNTKKIMIR